MFNVRQRKFLMLLLVIQAQNDAARHIVIKGPANSLSISWSTCSAKIKDLFKGWAGKGSALLPFRNLFAE